MHPTPTQPSGTFTKAGLVLLGLWLILRAGFALPILQEPFRVVKVERNTYLELAESLLDRGTYEGYSYEGMDLVRPPVYPLFLAAILKLANRNLAAVALVQLAISAGTCALVYLTARHWASPGAALAAAWLYALNPNSLFAALVALTETLFTFLLVLSVYWLARHRETPRWRWLIASGVALGLTVLIRPIGVWLLSIWALFTLFAWWGKPWRKRLLPALVLIAAAWAVYLPWQVRNYIVHGKFTVSTVSEATIRNWMIAEGLAEARGITRNQAVAEIAAAENPTLYSLELLRTYPGPMFKAAARGIYRTVVGFEYASWMYLLNAEWKVGNDFVMAALARDVPAAWRSGLALLRNGYTLQVGVTLWALVYNLLAYGLGVIGAVALLARRRFWPLAFTAVIIGYLIVSPTAAGQARFRVPAAPLLAILGGVGLSEILGWAASALRRERRA